MNMIKVKRIIAAVGILLALLALLGVIGGPALTVAVIFIGISCLLQ